MKDSRFSIRSHEVGSYFTLCFDGYPVCNCCKQPINERLGVPYACFYGCKMGYCGSCHRAWMDGDGGEPGVCPACDGLYGEL